ncbi:MAG: hypothetical protein F6J93_14575 [Oscillatoria sp. SIO1A7]|nr:hypothetical protein [Oscillatoria sp. SIO1A7]
MKPESRVPVGLSTSRKRSGNSMKFPYTPHRRRPHTPHPLVRGGWRGSGIFFSRSLLI